MKHVKCIECVFGSIMQDNIISKHLTASFSIVLCIMCDNRKILPINANDYHKCIKFKKGTPKFVKY
jgi:hypothetical protein